jgi:uncharacterized protein YigA (DUF484 family)
MPKPLSKEETAMHYKTITLEFIQQQPELVERLRTSRTLLSTVDLQAVALKRYHETWMERLSQAKPDSDPIQIASEALELALEDLRENLSSESTPSGEEPFSLDAAMNFLRKHSQPA